MTRIVQVTPLFGHDFSFCGPALILFFGKRLALLLIIAIFGAAAQLVEVLLVLIHRPFGFTGGCAPFSIELGNPFSYGSFVQFLQLFLDLLALRKRASTVA